MRKKSLWKFTEKSIEMKTTTIMTNRSNVSAMSEVETDDDDFKHLFVTIAIMTIPGLTANSLAFYCLIPDIKSKTTLVKLLLLALSIVDFCGCIGVVSLQILNVTHKINRWICACVSFLTVYFPILSGSIATFMAAERFTALRAPYWYQANMHTCKFWTPFAIVVCVITVVCGVPVASFEEFVRYKTTGNVTLAHCQPFPMAAAKTLKEAVFTLTYGFIGLVLVVSNLSLNAAVLATVYKMSKRIHPIPRIPNTQEFEITKMLLALSTTFLVCWVPLNLQLVLLEFGVSFHGPIGVISHIFLGINFVIDPLIYLIMKKKYREKMKRLFCCRKGSYNENNSGLGLTTLSSYTKDIFPIGR